MGLVGDFVGFGAFGHGEEDGNKFVCLFNEAIRFLGRNGAFFSEEFQPELGLISLLSTAIDFRNELFGTSGA